MDRHTGQPISGIEHLHQSMGDVLGMPLGNYVSKARHVENKFGKRRIVDISKSDIELFQAQMLKQGLSPKSVNDIVTVVRGVWADAFGDGF